MNQEMVKAEKRFANHKARLDILDENVRVLNWRQPGTQAYAIRAVHWKSENKVFQGPKTGIKKRPCVRYKTQGRFLLNASAFYLKRKGVFSTLF